MHAPQPRAWLGYAAFGESAPVVRICSKCPDRAQAEAQAVAAHHSMTHTLCERCACDTFNEILAMQTPDLSRAVAAAQLLANSIKRPVAVYSRVHCPVDGMREWKILPESDPEPNGFKREQLVQPNEKPSARL